MLKVKVNSKGCYIVLKGTIQYGKSEKNFHPSLHIMNLNLNAFDLKN